eukprot:TRINITY_DN8904_c0_g1_i1.p1 TRINITY_DN8904_c0_g1~~TRINITY_DN8904_c0_g1_i1.p1  ORF type:complete len:128 (-),score=40.24 TRINITY_DN8904_c0_g1_i1:568-951(-)
MGRQGLLPAASPAAPGQAPQTQGQPQIPLPGHGFSGAAGSSGRKRAATSADKEQKKLKRLLRNRVSAQQARERKKAYLGDLEGRSKELEQRNAELEEKVATLSRENFMLRQIMKNSLKKSNGGPGEQ